jgi:predicted enzyme related to lactoylglutathione lyase
MSAAFDPRQAHELPEELRRFGRSVRGPAPLAGAAGRELASTRRPTATISAFPLPVPAMAARLRHFALCVSDLEASAKFYEEVFGLKRVGEETLELGSGVYLSDGVVNLALLKLKGNYGTDGTDGSGSRHENTGPHHFGFIVDDVDAMRKRIEQAGGKFFFTLGDPEKHNFESKFKDPDGIIFDISKKGWLGSA